MSTINWDSVKYFKAEEFDCPHCGKNEMRMAFVVALDELRDRCGFPFKINSGYRCPQYNSEVSTTGTNGPHTTGQAADIGVAGTQAFLLVALAARHGMTGVGLRQTGPHNTRFVHVDSLDEAEGRPRPWVWTY